MALASDPEIQIDDRKEQNKPMTRKNRKLKRLVAAVVLVTVITIAVLVPTLVLTQPRNQSSSLG